MAIRTVRLEGDELLRKVSKDVTNITPHVVTVLEDMADTMYASNGVGLAAPQVGILKRMVVIDVGEEPGEDLIELINPRIIECSGTQTKAEGCLSIPGKSAPVPRPTYVKVEALNRFGESFVLEGTDLLAVAICHEIDHLDGILYVDKAVEAPKDIEDEEYEDLEEDFEGEEAL